MSIPGLADNSEKSGDPQLAQKRRVTVLPLAASTVNALVSPSIETDSLATPTTVE
jgi:hypothetical protein|tara:strand:- start:191 stop:355 length:165 start_codon:yes stop_codon:yes gene_type:complete